MRTGRFWPLVLLLYVVVDFTDPSIPGVFFFDTDQLFMEAAVTLAKTTPPTGTLAVSPRSVESARRLREPSVLARTFRAPGRQPDLRAQHRIRSDAFHDTSASVSSEDH
jgi:hypothetical protein